MQQRSLILRLYWRWNESHIRDTVHWVVFIGIGLAVVINLVSSITTNALNEQGFAAHAQATSAALRDI